MRAFFAIPLVLLASAVSAFEVDLTVVPDELRSLYEAKLPMIEELALAVTVSSQSDMARAQALQELQLAFPYVGLQIAQDVALESGPALQLAATQLLVNSVVMMNHPAGGDHAGHAPVMKSFDLLRQVFATGTPEASEAAAQAGASMGYRSMLDEIVLQNKKGVLGDAQTVGYLTLADPAIGADYVSPYLASDDASAQTESISYLGPLPAYQAEIRNRYLFDDSRPAGVQAAAARVLARTDVTFATYSDEVVGRPGVPPDVLEAVVQGSLENKTNPVNFQQLQKYNSMLLTYEKFNPDVGFEVLEGLRDQLDIIE